MLPAASACTDLAIRLLLRATNGYLAGNLAFALSHVRTPFVIKVEHDHPFVRPIDLISVVRDMSADKRLQVRSLQPPVQRPEELRQWRLSAQPARDRGRAHCPAALGTTEAAARAAAAEQRLHAERCSPT